MDQQRTGKLFLLRLLDEAIDAAEGFARKKKIAENLAEMRGIAANLYVAASALMMVAEQARLRSRVWEVVRQGWTESIRSPDLRSTMTIRPVKVRK